MDNTKKIQNGSLAPQDGVHASKQGISSPRDYANREYFAIETEIGVDSVLLQHPEFVYEHPVKGLEKYHVFSLPKEDVRLPHLASYGDGSARRRLGPRDVPLHQSLQGVGVKGVHMLPPKRLVRRAPVPVAAVDSSQEKQELVMKEFGINDPIFKDQWHIVNTNFPGHDVNVTPVWARNITGKGVVTALVDDGLDYESKDLTNNFNAAGSYDFNDHTELPKPRLKDDYHGTRCAAEIAAEKGNGYCGVGVAYGSQVAGIRILSGEITAADEAVAMIHGLDVNDIYSCSWGPPDDGASMEMPDKVVREAMLKGIQDGRDSKGALYVFASGNGGYHGDGCNFDGYTNSIYSITVSSIDHRGMHPPYAESCAAVLVVTYSSGSGEYIHTTDINDKCTETHGGTSAAAPLAAGIYSLVLEANPDLSWRDVQYLTVLGAAEVESHDPSWQKTAIEGRRYSPKYGWGKLDADKLVTMAQNWTALKPQSWFYMPVKSVDARVSDEVSSVKSTFEVTEKLLKRANLEKIEHVTVTVNIDATKRGDVQVSLVSPSGIRSELAVTRKLDRSTVGFKDWTFSSVAHWGESGVGNWTLEVGNTHKDIEVKFKNWQLKLFGESIDPTKAKRFNIDEDYSKLVDEENSSSSIGASSVQAITRSSETARTATPLGLHSTSSMTTTASVSSTLLEGLSTTLGEEVSPTASADPEVGDGEEGSYKDFQMTHYEEYFFFFLVIGFIICIWMLRSRAKPGRSRRRDEYEFDIIQPDEDLDSESAHFSRSQATDNNSSVSLNRFPASSFGGRNSLDAAKVQKMKGENSADKRYLSRDDEERERLYNAFNGIEDEDDPFGDSMYRISSRDE